MFTVIQSFLEHIVEMMVPDETHMPYTWQGTSITAVATHGKNLTPITACLNFCD